MRPTPYRLSVVLACARPSAPPGPSLAALREACRGIETEVVVALAQGSAVPEADGSEAFRLRLVSGAADALVPELWGLGARAATGDVIALTTPECRVPSGWATSLLEGIRAGATGVGGGFSLASDASPVTRAVYFLRYSAFLPPATAEPRAEIAGDNAAYDAAAIRRHQQHLAHGFWEVEFHRLIRAEGGSLVLAPGATVVFCGPIGFRHMWRQRFEHGVRFARWRRQELGVSRWRIVVAAPLVPVVLVARVLRRVRGQPGLLAAALAATPLVLAFATAWAAGEAVGGWQTRRLARRPDGM